MKKVLIAVALCMAFVFTTEAQERRGGFGGPGGFQARMIEMMKENIPNLTQVQTDSISAFMIRQAEEMRKNRPEPGQMGQGFDPEKMREMMEQRQKAQNEKFKSILTEEQYAAYQKWQEEMRKNRPQFQGGPMGGH